MVDRRQFEPQLLGHLLSPGRRSRRPPLSSQRRLEPRSGRPRADHDMPRSRVTAATRSTRRQNASRHVAPTSASPAAFRPRPRRSVGKAPPGIVTARDAPHATLRPLRRKGGVRPFRPGDRVAGRAQAASTLPIPSASAGAERLRASGLRSTCHASKSRNIGAPHPVHHERNCLPSNQARRRSR